MDSKNKDSEFRPPSPPRVTWGAPGREQGRDHAPRLPDLRDDVLAWSPNTLVTQGLVGAFAQGHDLSSLLPDVGPTLFSVRSLPVCEEGSPETQTPRTVHREEAPSRRGTVT